MRFGRGLGLSAAVAFLGCAGFAAFAWRAEIAPIERSARPAPDAQALAKGAELAAVGNCVACHTVPGGKAFAGGLALPTPFGTIYSTNITPDAETGIGRWSEAAFSRSMREGVDREGRHLYPAFPYDHFTLVSDEDNRAIYAYLMTRAPVRATAPENDLPFPLTFRPLMAGWKLLFFREGAYQPDPTRSAEWNRGAYLANGLGHCGGCHAPRNALGARDPDRQFAGGQAEGWNAYAIDASSPAPIPWTQESLAFYLRNGWHEAHGVSRGPMAEVTGNLARLPDADIAAIATYVADEMGEPTPEQRLRGETARAKAADSARANAPATTASLAVSGQTGSRDRGAAIYAGACGTCHDSGRPQPFGGLSLHLSSAVNAPDPQNIVNVTLFGLPPADGEASAVMPAYASVLDDEAMVALLNHMRARFTDKPAWTGLKEMVRDTRSGAKHVAVRPADGIERAPANVGGEE